MRSKEYKSIFAWYIYLNIRKLSSSQWWIQLFQNSNFCLKTWLLLMTSMVSILLFKLTGYLFFDKCKILIIHSLCVSHCWKKKKWWYIKKAATSAHQSQNNTIAFQSEKSFFWNATKWFFRYIIFHHTWY